MIQVLTENALNIQSIGPNFFISSCLLTSGTLYPTLALILTNNWTPFRRKYQQFVCTLVGSFWFQNVTCEFSLHLSDSHFCLPCHQYINFCSAFPIWLRYTSDLDKFHLCNSNRMLSVYLCKFIYNSSN